MKFELSYTTTYIHTDKEYSRVQLPCVYINTYKLEQLVILKQTKSTITKCLFKQDMLEQLKSNTLVTVESCSQSSIMTEH